MKQPRMECACKLDLNEHRQSLDTFDVRYWFAADPSACISDIAARKILREYEHSNRWWIKSPGKNEEVLIRAQLEKRGRTLSAYRIAIIGKGTAASIREEVRKSVEDGVREELEELTSDATQALAKDQSTPWWQSSRNHLAGFLPAKVGGRFADYLSGFVLVMENETPRSSKPWKEGNQKSNNDWRQLKRLVHTLNGGARVPNSMLPPSVNPPHRESLKTALTRIMVKELYAVVPSRRKIARTFLPQIWESVGERILSASFLRAERRSRRRTKRNR